MSWCCSPHGVVSYGGSIIACVIQRLSMVVDEIKGELSFNMTKQMLLQEHDFAIHHIDKYVLALCVMRLVGICVDSLHSSPLIGSFNQQRKPIHIRSFQVQHHMSLVC